ncbi:MAG TPA: MFS transporter [Solirubrobacteraceae bacterium]|nr:MFS transporter [Solirubrobacteraceae bacterium]
MANNYRAVLARPGALRLLSTALLGRMPQGMSSLAVLLLVRQATHSYAAAGAAVGAGALAGALCGPLLGRLIDRVGRRMVVGPASALQACVYVAFALAARGHAPALVLIVCATLAGALVPPIAPVVRALLRDLYHDHAVRETAYSMEAIAQETIWIVGPLATTVIVTVASPTFAVAILGVIGLSGTLLFMRSPLLDRPLAHEHGEAPHGSALVSVDLRWLLVPVALMGFSLGAVEVGIPSLALHDGSRPASGFLLALWSLGSMAGGIHYSSTRWRSALGSRYAWLLTLNCLVTAPLLFAGSIALAAVFSFCAGLAVAPTFSCVYSLVGHVMIPGSEHEAFGWTLSGLIAGVAAGSALAGAVIGPLGVRGPFLLAVGAAALAVAGAVRFRGRFGGEVALG